MLHLLIPVDFYNKKRLYFIFLQILPLSDNFLECHIYGNKNIHAWYISSRKKVIKPETKTYLNWNKQNN